MQLIIIILLISWTTLSDTSAKNDMRTIISKEATISTIADTAKDPESENCPSKIILRNYRTPEQIYNQIKYFWYREQPSISLIRACKLWSDDPRHCILVWLVLMYIESGNWQNSVACNKRNNCLGIQAGKKTYNTIDEGILDWLNRYNLYWRNATSPQDFYPDLWRLAKTRYCYSEMQHYPNIWCPDGQKIAIHKWNQLEWIIYP